jgi:hypothetical protein
MKQRVLHDLISLIHQCCTFERLYIDTLIYLIFLDGDLHTVQVLRFVYDGDNIGAFIPCLYLWDDENDPCALLDDVIMFLHVLHMLEATMINREYLLYPTLDEVFLEELWGRFYSASLLENLSRIEQSLGAMPIDLRSCIMNIGMPNSCSSQIELRDNRLHAVRSHA